MYIINVTDAKAKFSEVVNQVLNGEEVIVERMGIPVVRICRYEPAKTRGRLGLMAGQANIPANFDDWSQEEAQALGIID